MISDYPYEIHLLARFMLAVLCGALIGYERERHGVSAGLRTNIFVCAGAALMMIVSKYFYYKSGEIIDNIDIGLDPSRIAASIVSGIGFLGAGVIIKERGSVRGLTTAATLWYSAGLGMACGAGMIILPLFCTLVGITLLASLKRLSSRIARDQYKTIVVECAGTAMQNLQALQNHFAARGVRIVDIDFRQKISEAKTSYHIVVKGHWQSGELIAHVSDLAELPFVTQTSLD